MKKYAGPKLEIRVESLPERCEICHKSDQFNPETNFCSRCNGIMAMVSNTRQRPKVFSVPEVIVENQKPHLTLIKRWYKPSSGILAAAIGLWSVGVLAGFFSALDHHGLSTAFASYFLTFLVILSLSYWAAASVVNRSTIKVSAGELSVRQGPLPWPGNHTIRISDFDQIYCETVAGKRGRPDTYQVCADMKNGRRLSLLGGFDAPEPAIFIEQQIEERLGIIDRPVHGELPRR